LDENVEIWFEEFMYAGEYLTNWDEFYKAICKRFGSRDDIVEEFNKLIQDNGVKDHMEKFEE
jgi:hypothetical protein